MNKKMITFALSGLLCVGTLCSGALVLQKVSANPNDNPNKTETRDYEAVNNDIIALYPGNGQNVSILKAPVLNYIRAMKAVNLDGVDDYKINDKAGVGVSIRDYYSDKEQYEKSKSITLIWANAENVNVDSYKVYVGKKIDLSDATVYETTNTQLSLINLYSATTYYWKVVSSDGTKQSSISSFTTEDYSRMITAGNILNIRDIGGHMTSSGKRVKQGIIFRGAEVVKETYKHGDNTHTANTSEEALKVFTDEMKIGIEVDFRGEEESKYATTSDIGDDVEYDRQSIGGYTAFNYSSSSSIAKFKDIFEKLANANEKHVYFHCWGGADRTGTVGFLLNGLLGVSYTDLIIDYEVTSFSRNLRTRENMNNNIAYFADMVKELNTKYCDNGEKTISEGVEAWLIQRLGFTSEQVAQMKANLLED